MATSITYPTGSATPFLELTRRACLSSSVGDPLTILTAKPHLWIIELKNGIDNRLTSAFINTGIKPALDEVERQWRDSWGKSQETGDKKLGKGALIIVGRRDQDKFFSNGAFPFLSPRPEADGIV